MSGLDHEIDVQFFELIHSLQTNQPIRHADRRRTPRQFAGKTCRVAVCELDGPFPAYDEFFNVFCYDLTRHGFGFFSEEPPEYDRLVVEFGSGEKKLYLEAEVRRCDRILILPTGAIEYVSRKNSGSDSARSEATPQFLIGCQFLHRRAPD